MDLRLALQRFIKVEWIRILKSPLFHGSRRRLEVIDQMRIQWKVVLLVGLLVASCVTIVSWKASSQIRDERTAQFTKTSEVQLAPVRRLVQAKLDLAKEQLLQFTRRKESGNVNISAFGDFDMVSLSFESAPGNWEPKWIERRSDRNRWDNQRGHVMVRSLKYDKLRDGNVQWAWRMTKDGNSVFAIMVPVQVEAASPQGGENLPDQLTQSAAQAPKRGVVVGFFARNTLGVIANDFIGAQNSVFVVDDAGYVAAHSSRNYIGTLFTQDDVVKEIRANLNRVSKSGRYENLDGDKILARWEHIEGSNLFAVISTPVKHIEASANQTQKTMLWWGVVGTFLSMLATFFASRLLLVQPAAASLGRPSDAGITFIGESPAFVAPKATPLVVQRPVQQVQSVAPAPEKAAAIAKQTTPAETSEAYRQLALGLSRELRTPLAAMLGHVQLLKEKAEGESKSHTEAIENDARYLKEVIEALTGVAGEQNLHVRPTSLSEITKIAVNNLEKELQTAGVDLKVEADSAPVIEASAVHLQKAIEGLLRGSIEALRTRPGSELRVRVFAMDGSVRLQIRDTGIGMNREQTARYFEPFFQSYEGAQNLGLTLAMAHAVLERHKATVSVESIPGTGTTITADFKPSAEQVKTADVKPSLANIPDFAPPKNLTANLSPPPTVEAESAPVVQTTPMTPRTPPPPKAPESNVTLGGKKPVSAIPTPPSPSVDELEAQAYSVPLPDLSLPTESEEPIERTVSIVLPGEPPKLTESTFSDGLPPMDLSRTLASPDAVKELEMPSFAEDIPTPPALDESVVSHEFGTSGTASGVATTDANAGRVRIRRPKPKGHS